MGWYVYRYVGAGFVRGVVVEAENNYDNVGFESEMLQIREEYWDLHMDLQMGLNLYLIKKLIFSVGYSGGFKHTILYGHNNF